MLASSSECSISTRRWIESSKGALVPTKGRILADKCRAATEQREHTHLRQPARPLLLNHQGRFENLYKRNDVPKIIRQALATGAVLVLTGLTFVSAQGRGRGSASGPPDPPPGQGRKVTPVPEPVTLTLLGVGLGAGLVMRRLKSRRTRSHE